MNHNEYKKADFCASLIKIRKERGLTQAEVATALGISDKTYSKWECGDTEPGISSILSLAEIYKISPGELFGGKDSRSIESRIHDELTGLPIHDAADRAFEIQFHAIRELVKSAFDSSSLHESPIEPTVPENRVNPRNSHAITAYAVPGVYQMMYNGDDANISLSLMPNKEKYGWLISERDRISSYLKLIADTDMLKCLIHMTDSSFAHRYTAKYLASISQVDAQRVKQLLCECVKLGICSVEEAFIGEQTVELYRTEVDQMLFGILTLAHLSLPEAEKNGCWYTNLPARLTMTSSEVK